MADNAPSMLDIKGVIDRVPLSRSTIYAKVASGDFPAPVKISENRVAWDSAKIDEWINSKLAAAA